MQSSLFWHFIEDQKIVRGDWFVNSMLFHMFANQRSGRFYFKHFFCPKIKIVHTFFASNVCWLEFFVATTDTLDRKSLLNITINFTVQHLIRINLKDINELECLLTDGSIVEWRLQFGIFKSPCYTGPWTEKKNMAEAWSMVKFSS